ncbi:MAG: hypothetical protein IPP52_13730 [Ignavibacteria bacterium]|nr:hypothetical protein [Ignavibacteria bacterium]
MNIKNFNASVFLLIFTFLFAGKSSSFELNNVSLNYNTSSIFRKNTNDTIKGKLGKSSVRKTNVGGLFIAPSIGVSFPMGKFGDYSNAGLIYGAKAELAYSRLYPFIFGFVYEYQKFPGNGEFTTSNSLTQYDTKITSIGGSLDIVLNKFLHSNFTTPVLMLEVKYAKITKDISPLPVNNLVIPGDANLLTYSGGMGFTIYILDLCVKYTYASEYSNLTFQAKFHFPVFKF